MRTRSSWWIPAGFVTLVLAMLGLGVGLVSTGAQEAPAAEEVILPSARVTVEPAELRTPEQMDAAEPLAAARAAAEASTLPTRRLPTADPEDYAAAKAAARAGTASGRGISGKDGSADPEALAPPVVTGGFSGLTSTNCGGCRPPDTHGAVGPSHYVQAVNTSIRVFNKVGAVLQTRTLLALFGGTESLFDPRVVYDPIWNRWVIMATRKAVSPADPIRRFRIAVSRTGDPTGAYFIYTFFFNVAGGSNGNWWDYPGLGFDQDAVIITGNVFDCVIAGCSVAGANVFVTGALTPIAKARLYNGLGFSVPIFTVGGSPQPPLVLDQNNVAVISRVAGSPNVQLLKLSNGSNPSQATLVAANVNVGGYSTPPPDAAQPGTANLLDTLDGRFQNASTQFGNTLYQVHTVGLGGLATPRIYKINIATNTQFAGFPDLVFVSATSDDFNPGIAASAVDRAVVTWTATRVASAGVSAFNALVRATGKNAADLNFLSTAGATIPTGTSGTFYNPSTSTVERWGDYSAVTVDPSNARRFWVTNERIISNGVWGSTIGHVTFP